MTGGRSIQPPPTHRVKCIPYSEHILGCVLDKTFVFSKNLYTKQEKLLFISELYSAQFLDWVLIETVNSG